MNTSTDDKSQEMRRPIVSLISKCEKAQKKLMVGSWQHAMLRDHLKALNIASKLMDQESESTVVATKADLQEALQTFATMINRTESIETKFAPGTAHYSLQRNRFRALRVAEALVKAKMDDLDRDLSASVAKAENG